MDEHPAEGKQRPGIAQGAVRRSPRLGHSAGAARSGIWIPKGTRTAGTPAEHHEFTINSSDFAAEDWGYLLGLDIYQDRMGQLLNDAFIKVTVEGWSDSNRRHQPESEYSLEDLIACVKCDQELNGAYQSETRRAVLQQLTTYHRNPLFEDQGTTLQDFLKPGRMSVIVMNKMSDELRLIAVSALLRRLIASRVQASEAEKHLKILETLQPRRRLPLKPYGQMRFPRHGSASTRPRTCFLPSTALRRQT